MDRVKIPDTTIDAKIGVGAYGEVYKAYNSKLGIHTAVKISTKTNANLQFEA
jgi:hypothetical protein